MYLNRKLRVTEWHLLTFIMAIAAAAIGMLDS